MTLAHVLKQARMLTASAPFAALATSPAAAAGSKAGSVSPLKKAVNAVKGLRDKVRASTCGSSLLVAQ